MFKNVLVANGKAAYEVALFDTGAAVCLIDAQIASQLGLHFTGRKIPLESVSGQVFYTYEAIALIYVPEANCWRRQEVYVPEESIEVGEKVIIGRDYMQSVKMGLEYQDGEKIWSSSSKDASKSFKLLPPLGTLAGTIAGGISGGSKGALKGGLIGFGIDCIANVFYNFIGRQN